MLHTVNLNCRFMKLTFWYLVNMAGAGNWGGS